MNEVFVRNKYDNAPRPEFIIHDREIPEFEARIALGMIERWGLVAATPDGEDSAGRSKLRMPTPEELVTRACNIAALAAEAFRARGWMTQVPSYAEAVEKQKSTDDE